MLRIRRFKPIFEFRKTVVNLAVAEGPAVQGIYQQVIREFPDLIGGGGPKWGSKSRRLVNEIRVIIIKI